MTRYAQHLKSTQQEQDRPDQVQNNAGGYVFQLDTWKRLERFLILGSDGGTYYVGERALTRDNAKVVEQCLAADGKRTVDTIVQISQDGRAIKNDPAIFALALAVASGDAATRNYAYQKLNDVCRTGTHLFQFLADVDVMRKWSTGLRKSIGRWYTTRGPDSLALQVAKYQQRGGWSHRDALRLAHVVPKTPEQDAVFRWVTSDRSLPVEDRFAKRAVTRKNTPEKVWDYETISPEALPKILHGFEAVKKAKTAKEVADLIRAYRLTHEMVPNEWKNDKGVWLALSEDMGMTALIRNLAKLTSIGLIAPLSATTKRVVEQLGNMERLRKERVHPIALLIALSVYRQGHGDKGSLTWTPVPQVIDALDDAFYLAFKTIDPVGKNFLLGIDVSGSMDGPPGFCRDSKGNSLVGQLTPREMAGALAMVTAKVETSWHALGFSAASNGYGGKWGGGDAGLTDIGISPRMRLDEVVRKMRAIPMGGTDCSLPMRWAMERKVEVDTFVVYTDNETWAGPVHPYQALRDYRQAMSRPAKLVVMSMVPTAFSIADPNDAGMLDLVGADSASPSVIADFSR